MMRAYNPPTHHMYAILCVILNIQFQNPASNIYLKLQIGKLI